MIHKHSLRVLKEMCLACVWCTTFVFGPRKSVNRHRWWKKKNTWDQLIHLSSRPPCAQLSPVSKLVKGLVQVCLILTFQADTHTHTKTPVGTSWIIWLVMNLKLENQLSTISCKNQFSFSGIWLYQLITTDSVLFGMISSKWNFRNTWTQNNLYGFCVGHQSQKYYM